MLKLFSLYLFFLLLILLVVLDLILWTHDFIDQAFLLLTAQHVVELFLKQILCLLNFLQILFLFFRFNLSKFILFLLFNFLFLQILLSLLFHQFLKLRLFFILLTDKLLDLIFMDIRILFILLHFRNRY